jgi:trk system potassium uptake protein TrkH
MKLKRSATFLIILTFATAISIGTFLLRLPISTQSESIGFLEALFTSASAVTVTGLIVVDTATYFTHFGQTVILLLIQFGGLGFMTFSTLFILLLGRRISLADKFIIVNDFTSGNYRNVRDLLKKIFIFTFGIELLGALFLFFQLPQPIIKERLYSAIFHSVSAFCNAGFSVNSNSLVDYADHTCINLTFSFLIIFGGLGFLVLAEVFTLKRKNGKKGFFKKLSLHSKLMIIISAILTFGGFLVILAEELFNAGNTLPLSTKIITSFFQSVTARTAGFNTMDLNILSLASIFFMLILMFIGASPGSTGGGVKTSSVGMVLAYFRARMRGRESVDVFYRNIPAKSIEKSFIVIILSILIVSFAFLLLLSFETRFRMIDLLFETVSAFGTVGLSLGLTAQLSVPSQIVIIITMFIGRIGPLTLLMALSKRESKAVFHYPQENIMIG